MTDLRTPEERECERCGRREIWDADAETWRVAKRDQGGDAGADADAERADADAERADADAERADADDDGGDPDGGDTASAVAGTAAGRDLDGAVGDVHCVHEWDIDGSFQPIE